MTSGKQEDAAVYRIDQGHLEPARHGVGFPAWRWQIIAWAEHSGAGVPLRVAPRTPPERTYTDLAQIVREVNTANASAADPTPARGIFPVSRAPSAPR